MARSMNHLWGHC